MNRHKKALEVLARGTVIPATPLAIDENRRFDPEQQKLLTGYYLAAGAGGIATAVHSTQFAIRNPEHAMLEPVLSAVADEIADFEAKSGKTIVKVSGVCGRTNQAVREAEIARSYGYDALLASPGGLSELSEAEILERTIAIGEVLPVIGFYLQPAVGGRIFSREYWEKLCEIPSVVAIKCAPFNRYLTLDVVRACALSSRADEITLYTGNDDNIVIDLLTEFLFTSDGRTNTARFKGGLLGHWSVWTKRVVELFETLRSRPADSELLTLAAEITDSNGAVFDSANNYAGCIAGIHEVLRRQGLMKGIWCLDPQETLSPGQSEELDRVCAMYPHLTDDEFVKEYLAGR